jgi:hypothetical protein
MASSERPTSERIHALIEELDRTVRDAEVVRFHVERQLRSRPFYPERRDPRHWDYVTDRSDRK